MIRAALLAAALLSATAAGALPPAENGAVAGRSPQRAYRALAVDEVACGRPAAFSVPAGKGHVWGSRAIPVAPCGAAESAALTDPAVQRD